MLVSVLVSYRPAGVEEADGPLPLALWLGVFLTAHCMERGAWAAVLACEALVVLSSGSSSRNVSWSTSSLWLLLLSESLESFDWESSSEKKAGTLLAPSAERKTKGERKKTSSVVRFKSVTFHSLTFTQTEMHMSKSHHYKAEHSKYDRKKSIMSNETWVKQTVILVCFFFPHKNCT